MPRVPAPPVRVQPTIVGEEQEAVERRSVLEDAAAEADAQAALDVPSPEVLAAAARSLADVKYETAEEALEAVGFLADRPPLEHGESGHSFYTVQVGRAGGQADDGGRGSRAGRYGRGFSWHAGGTMPRMQRMRHCPSFRGSSASLLQCLGAVCCHTAAPRLLSRQGLACARRHAGVLHSPRSHGRCVLPALAPCASAAACSPCSCCRCTRAPTSCPASCPRSSATTSSPWRSGGWRPQVRRRAAGLPCGPGLQGCVPLGCRAVLASLCVRLHPLVPSMLPVTLLRRFYTPTPPRAPPASSPPAQAWPSRRATRRRTRATCAPPAAGDLYCPPGGPRRGAGMDRGQAGRRHHDPGRVSACLPAGAGCRACRSRPLSELARVWAAWGCVGHGCCGLLPPVGCSLEEARCPLAGAAGDGRVGASQRCCLLLHPWPPASVLPLVCVRCRHGEPFNVLRYEPSQHYDSHYDSFSEEEYGPQFSQRVCGRGGGGGGGGGAPGGGGVNLA